LRARERWRKSDSVSRVNQWTDSIADFRNCPISGLTRTFDYRRE
jgi:hypothetical protein